MRERIQNIWQRLRGRPSPALRSAAESQASAVPEPAEQPIAPVDQARIQQLGRARAIESFEGWQHLEAVRVTMSSLERGVNRGLDWSRRQGQAVAEQSRRVRGWWSRNRGSGSESAAPDMNVSPADQAEARQSGFASLSRELLDEAGRLAGAAKDLATSGYRDAGEWLRTSGLGYMQSALDYLLAHDPATWTRKRAARALKGHSPAARDLAAVHNSHAALAAMRRLSAADRRRLLDELYPYDRPGFAASMKAIDLTINLSLGAIVASNLPFTGAVVSLINMIKTIFRIAHRLHLMSTVYGYHIKDSNALFVASARILQSLQSWESDSAEHTPLDPAIIAELYADDAADQPGMDSARSDGARESALPALLNATLKKDAYISVPGVGTVGLGKIPLDDARLDACVQTLVSDYFDAIELRERYGSARVDQQIASYRAVYAEFHRQDFFRVGRADRKARAAEASASADPGDASAAAEPDKSESESVRVAAGRKAAELGRGAQRLFRRVSQKTSEIAVDEYYVELSAELDRVVAEIQSGAASADVVAAVKAALPE